MSRPIFLSVEQVLTLIMGELPEGVYPLDRADDPDTTKRSYSSSELRAHAQMLANLYLNLQGINQNKFVSTMNVDGVAPWNGELFSSAQDGSLSFEMQKSNLLAKRRAQGSISLPSIKAVVASILDPLGIAFDILPYSGQNYGSGYGAWILGFSQLGFDTWLALEDPLLGTGLGDGQTPLDCALDYAAAGITLQDLENIQATAYTYEIRIYGLADTNTLNLLENLLTASEPARSTHIITNNASPPDTPIDTGTYEWNTDYLYWWTS